MHCPIDNWRDHFKRDISIFRGNCIYFSSNIGKPSAGKDGDACLLCSGQLCLWPHRALLCVFPLSLLLLGTQRRLPWGRMGWGNGGLSSLNPWVFTSLCALKKESKILTTNIHKASTQGTYSVWLYSQLRRSALLRITKGNTIHVAGGQRQI